MSIIELTESEVVGLLREKGFSVTQSGFNLSISYEGQPVGLGLIVTVDGVWFTAQDSDENYGETALIPWAVFGKLQDAIEQAILTQAQHIQLRHELTARMNQKEDEDDKH